MEVEERGERAGLYGGGRVSELERFRKALEDIASEDCTYFDCNVGGCDLGHNEDDPDCVLCGDDVELHYDPECPGSECHARRALAGVDLVEHPTEEAS